MAGLTITGVVFFRSSLKNPPGPVGEKEILALNPQRAVCILNKTGWSALEPGSLNLKVAPGVVESLGKCRQTWIEEGATVIYPPPFAHIPSTRRAYWYYLGTATRNGQSQEVLVRRAQNPLPTVVELFAPTNLTKHFGLVGGEEIEVVINAI